MRQSRIMTFFFYILSIVSVSAYKPVILVHGAFGTVDKEFGSTFEKWIPAVSAIGFYLFYLMADETFDPDLRILLTSYIISSINVTL